MRKMKEYKGRKVVFIASYGSTNYGTRTPESDNDYKVFLMPTFEDLYESKMFSEKAKIDGDDYEFHDIRKLAQLFYKSNPAYLEILAAKEMHANKGYVNFVNWLLINKEDISYINLKAYHNALIGMAKQKLTAIVKDLPNSDENEGYKRRMKFGFDTKQLMHVVRLMAMREATFEHGVPPLDCVNLEDDNEFVGKKLRDRLIDIKENKDNYTKEDAIRIGKELVEQEFNTVVSQGYTSKNRARFDLDILQINEDINQRLIEIIMTLVKEEFENGGE